PAGGVAEEQRRVVADRLGGRDEAERRREWVVELGERVDALPCARVVREVEEGLGGWIELGVERGCQREGLDAFDRRPAARLGAGRKSLEARGELREELAGIGQEGPDRRQRRDRGVLSRRRPRDRFLDEGAGDSGQRAEGGVEVREELALDLGDRRHLGRRV